MKKLVWVEGNSGRLYKMFLHKEPNNERGWYITERQYHKMCDREPFGWKFDIEDLKRLNAGWVHLHHENRSIRDVDIKEVE